MLLGFNLDLELVKERALGILAILPSVLGALLLLLIGCKIINCTVSRLQNHLSADKPAKQVDEDLERQSPSFRRKATFHPLTLASKTSQSVELDPTVLKFALSFASNGLKCVLLIACASMVHIPTQSFVAVLTMVSLAIGLAMKDLLKDLAAGLLLLVFRPFDIGDLVDSASQKGIVYEIGLFETVLRTVDNNTIIIPNSEIRIITNIYDQNTVRVDIPFKISHDSSLRNAKDVLLQAAQACPIALADPAVKVLVTEVDEFGRTLIIRAWLLSENYLNGPHAIREQAILALDDAGISLAQLPGSAAYLKKLLSKQAGEAENPAAKKSDVSEAAGAAALAIAV